MKKIEHLETEQGSASNSPRFHDNQILVKFSPAFTRNFQNKFITEQVITTLSDPNCFIYQNYHQQNWAQIFMFIEESHCRRFFLMQTGVPTIVEQISKIKFVNLKQIDLSCNRISSVEGVPFLRVPHIKSLVLRNNLILNLNSLRRGKWKNLEVLDIGDNLVVEWKRMGEIWVNKDQIQQFSIEFWNMKNRIEVEDVAKLLTKLGWSSKSYKIESQIEFKGGKRREMGDLNTIKMHPTKCRALMRKFEKKCEE